MIVEGLHQADRFQKIEANLILTLFHFLEI